MARQRAPAVCRNRPRKSQGAGCADRRSLWHARSNAGHRLCQRFQQIRPHLAGADVGGTGIPQAPGRCRLGLCALGTRRDGAAVGPGQGQLFLGTGFTGPLQQPAGGENLRLRQTRLQFGRGHCRHGAHCQGNAARGLHLRLGRRLIPGKTFRRHLGAGAGTGGADGVPDSGRAVRPLVAAAGRDAGTALRHLRRTGGDFHQQPAADAVLPGLRHPLAPGPAVAAGRHCPSQQ